MSSFKAELRANILHDVGVRFDDQLESAKAEAHRYEGAKQALWQAIRKVEDHTNHVDRDLREGKYASIEDADREKRRIQECAGILRNLAVTAEVNQHIARGKAEALEQAVKELKAQHDVEHARALQLKAAEQNAQEESRTQGPRLPGTHPGLSIKEQRLAEAAAKRLAESTAQTPQDTAQTAAVPSASTEVIEPPPSAEAQETNVIPIKLTPSSTEPLAPTPTPNGGKKRKR